MNKLLIIYLTPNKKTFHKVNTSPQFDGNFQGLVEHLYGKSYYSFNVI